MRERHTGAEQPSTTQPSHIPLEDFTVATKSFFLKLERSMSGEVSGEAPRRPPDEATIRSKFRTTSQRAVLRPRWSKAGATGR